MSAVHITRSTAKTCLCLFCVFLLLSGCALHNASEFVSRYTEADLVNTVQVHHGDGVVITTYGRVLGKKENRIRQVQQIASIENNFLKINLVTDISSESLADRLTETYDETTRLFHHALTASLRRSLSNLDLFNDRMITITLVADELGSGKSFSRQTRLEDDTLNFGFIFAVGAKAGVDLSRPEWWSQAANSIAHELVHMKHGINRTKLSPVNGETAAELQGICTQVDFVKMLDVDAVFDLAEFIENDVIETAFPGLRDGEFSANLDHLDFMVGPSPQGRTVANAVVYLHSDDGKIYMNESDSTHRLLQYCKKISVRVPDFQSGEL